MADVDKIVAHYVKLRDRKAEMAERHKEELRPINEDMGMIESALMKHLQDQGAKSMRTAHGTPYITEVESVKITDKDAVLDTVVEQGCWDVLNVSVAKKNLRESGIELPGIETTTVRKLNVKRSP